ncbi:hypothetical protein L596_013442 [Steinernema carpocapsae]|uniref:G-protein coupled receptors family 1 profile domain-containing protein n=1 Tax=Steinernema carpocapsae TaxID=34508 RepID=A0A4U5P058_STECR|nr:hypothetical protein L596_013442 [Steinernema carpocapsae]
MVDCITNQPKGTGLVAGKDVFSNHAEVQIAVSCFNLIEIASVLYESSKIDKKDMSRLYTLWLFYVQTPSDVVQIVISILQLLGLVDSFGMYYRDYADFVQMTGKLFLDLSILVYRTLALVLVLATYMSYKYLFVYARIFKPTAKHRRQLLSVIIYVTMPNIQVTLQAMTSVLSVMVSMIPNNKKRPEHPIIMTSGVFQKINRYGGYFRIPILAISTFAAFAAYRRVFVANQPFKKLRVSVTAVTSMSFSQLQGRAKKPTH